MNKHMNVQALVSIIIPCYNTEKYISQTLDSILNQKFNNFEVIWVNDGSTDSTLDIIKDYILRDSRISCIDQENTYYIQARRNGIKRATGKYLLFLDSDDKLSPDYLAKCVKIAEDNEELNIVYSKARLFDAKNESWKLPPFQLKSFLMNNCIYCSALIRRTAYDKTDGFDTSLKMLEDWDLYISIIEKSTANCVYRIEEELFFYRKRQDNSSITNRSTLEKRSDNQLKIYIKHYEFYKKNGLFLQDFFNARITIDRKYSNSIVKLFYYLFNKRKYKIHYS